MMSPHPPIPRLSPNSPSPGKPRRKALALALLSAALTAPLAASTLEWSLLPDTCTEPSGGLVVACGDYGRFFFGSPLALTCTPDAGNSEILPVYSERGDYTFIADGAPLEPLRGRGEPIGGAATGTLELGGREGTYQPVLPCAEGSCFGPPGGATGTENWVALVDWQDWHGWTTGYALARYSGLSTTLFAVDDTRLVSALGSSISDAHVMASLCAIATLADSPTVPAPAAVNMSFGRVPETEERVAGESCDENSFSCQLRRVMDHLDDQGIPLVASSGNHLSMLFPASYGSVTSVGSLDLAIYMWFSVPWPSWETPAGTDVLLPGYGLCFDHDLDSTTSQLWPAPAGSSYAAALYSAWIGYLADQGSTIPKATNNTTLAWNSTKACFQLSNQIDGPCQPDIDSLLVRISGLTGRSCWNVAAVDPVLTLEGPFSTVSMPNVPSLDTWVSNSHNPAPEADYCVPCVIGGGGGGGQNSMAQRSSGEEGGKSPTGTVTPTIPDLVLDLSSSSIHASAGLRLSGLYLRSAAGSVYSLLDENNGGAQELANISRGEYSSLLVTQLQVNLTQFQGSLIHVLCPEESSLDCFWTSTPIHVPFDPTAP